MSDSSPQNDSPSTPPNGQGGPAPEARHARSVRFRGNLASLISIVLAVAVFVMVNYLAYRHYYVVDFSPTRFYSLSDKTRSVLEQLDSPLTITTYFAPTDLNPSRVRGEVEDLLRQYQDAGGGQVDVRNIDPALDQATAMELSSKYNFGEEENVVIFEYKDRHRYLRESQLAVFENQLARPSGTPRMLAFTGEAEFTGAVLALIEGTPSKVYFLEGHGERRIDDATGPSGIGKLAAYVRRDNIEVESLNLGEFPEVPEDTDALVIAGPRQSMSALEVEAIAAYLARRGKVLLFQDPDTTSGLESLLQRFHIKLDNDLIVAIGRNSQTGRTTLLGQITATDFADHPAVRSLNGFNLIVSKARSISLLPGPDGKVPQQVVPLLETPAGYWGETNFAEIGAQFDPKNDIAGPLIVAALFDGGAIPGEDVNVSETKLVVVGSSFFLSNIDLKSVAVDFFTSVLNWSLEKDMAVGINPKFPLEYPLNVSPLQMRTINTFALTLVPGIALVAGVLVWYSRRK